MNIALDYDDTYTADVMFWDKFIEMAHMVGHTVYIVTARKQCGYLESSASIPKKLHDKCLVVFCNHDYKDEICRKRGLHIDIWIDDRPENVREGPRSSGGYCND